MKLSCKDKDVLNLYQWNDPLELALALSPTNQENNWQIVALREYQKHREAWALSRFAVGYQNFFKNKTEVKMVSDQEQSPDGFLKIDSKDIPFEVTMVLNPERKMSQEIKEAVENERLAQNGSNLKFEPMHYPSKTELLDWIKDGIQKKRRGAYEGLHLLIYLNTWHQQLNFTDLAILKNDSDLWTDVWIVCSSGLHEQYAIASIKNKKIPGWFEFQLGK